MANRTVYVDGTTSGSPGGGAHYATLNAALAGEVTVDSGNLTTTGGVLTIECSIAGADSTNVSWPTFSGATAENYISITVTAGSRHAGVWSTSKYYLNLTTFIAIPTAYTRISGIQVTTTSTTGMYITGTNTLIDGIIFKAAGDNNNGILVAETCNGNITQNCIVYDCARNGFSYVPDSSSTVTFYNCTAVDCGRNGFSNEGTASNRVMVCTNCLAYSNGDGATYFDYLTGSGTLTLTACASLDTTGTSGLTGISDPFVNYAGDNFHVASPNATLIGTGSNLHSTFTGDIDALTGTRPNGAFTIGADEPAAASVPIKKFMHAYRAHRS